MNADVPRPAGRPVVFLGGAAIKTPPFTGEVRVEAGMLLGRLQEGEMLGMPASRPMPSIGPRCHELRIADAGHDWRIVYRIDRDAIVVPCLFPKGSRKTPKQQVDLIQRRLAEYDAE